MAKMHLYHEQTASENVAETVHRSVLNTAMPFTADEVNSSSNIEFIFGGNLNLIYYLISLLLGSPFHWILFKAIRY